MNVSQRILNFYTHLIDQRKSFIIILTIKLIIIQNDIECSQLSIINSIRIIVHRQGKESNKNSLIEIQLKPRKWDMKINKIRYFFEQIGNLVQNIYNQLQQGTKKNSIEIEEGRMFKKRVSILQNKKDFNDLLIYQDQREPLQQLVILQNCNSHRYLLKQAICQPVVYNSYHNFIRLYDKYLKDYGKAPLRQYFNKQFVSLLLMVTKTQKTISMLDSFSQEPKLIESCSHLDFLITIVIILSYERNLHQRLDGLTELIIKWWFSRNFKY
ncbi:hypothetical protein pb186bvf_014298 [Paramecium bursaria]